MSELQRQLTPLELKIRMDNGDDIELIDVRERREHEQFDIGGRLIPLGEIMNKSEEIPRDKEVVFYCKMGIRSQIAIQRLQQRFGLTNLINLKGGLEAWKRDLGIRH